MSGSFSHTSIMAWPIRPLRRPLTSERVPHTGPRLVLMTVTPCFSRARASQQQIESWFERLGIADKLHAKTAHLSFGQQQRVAMIRTLVQPSDFILVDEPISHLDDTNSHIMGEMMMEEARAQGAGVIVTSIGKHMDLDYEKTFRL